MGAIGTKEKNHGIEESDQETEEGQEAAADEEPLHRSQYGGRIRNAYPELVAVAVTNGYAF